MKHTQWNAPLILILASVLLGGIAWYTSQQRINAPADEVTPIPINIPSSWNTITHDEYTFQYPSEAKGETQESESVISYMGPKQIASGRTQTELFDGYAFRIGSITTTPNTPLEQVAKNQHDNAQQNCQVQEGTVSPATPVSIDGQDAFQYSAKGCYLDYTETIVVFNDTVYMISQSYTGEAEDQKRYQAITNQILSSLKFTR